VIAMKKTAFKKLKRTIGSNPRLKGKIPGRVYPEWYKIMVNSIIIPDKV